MAHGREISFMSSALFVLLGLISLLPKSSNALLCYQCADTTSDSPCFKDYRGLVNTSHGITDFYKKNCTAANDRWDRCVIEQYIATGGKTTLFKRGCHDGVYFNKNVLDKEFQNLTANNFTTCTRPASNLGQLVCFTFCKTNYCNGPWEEKDPCFQYDPYDQDAVLPNGTVCGSVGIYSNSNHQSLLILMAACMLPILLAFAMDVAS